MRRHLELTAVARAALFLEKDIVQPLQVDGTRGEHGEGEKQRAEQDGRTETRQRERRRLAARKRRRVGPHRFAPAGTISTRDAFGNSMPSAERAIFSTRAGIAHVDCSSCNWPNSVS